MTGQAQAKKTVGREDPSGSGGAKPEPGSGSAVSPPDNQGWCDPGGVRSPAADGRYPGGRPDFGMNGEVIGTVKDTGRPLPR